MNVAILITELEKKRAAHTTIRLGRELTNRGHSVWFLAPGDFSLDSQDKLWMNGRRVPRANYKQSESYLRDLTEDPVLEPLSADETDLLLLRDNPSKYDVTVQWAKSTGAIFGRMAAQQGVVVVNDPGTLAQAVNKLYFQSFPREVRPLSLITRKRNEIQDFAQHLKGDMILKPLQGSGGEGVFLVKKSENYNLNQLTDALFRDGYVIAQEYLPEATRGDLRIFCMNGEPLKVKDKYAAFQRITSGHDIRSNLHAGGRLEKAEVTPQVLKLCDMVKSQLIADGLFLVGLDIVGDKIMEINLFCPGGLEGMERLEGVGFSKAVTVELEQKVEAARKQGRVFCNRTLCTQVCATG